MVDHDDDDFGLEDFGGKTSANSSSVGQGPPKGTIQIGKVIYAVDLQWELPSEAAKVDKEAREYAVSRQSSSDRPDFYCVRAGSKAQFGLGFAAQGHKIGMPSLAVHIASNKGSNFVAVFEVPDGYYLLAVKDDLILSDSERFIANKREAMDELSTIISMGDYTDIIAPADFKFPRAKSTPIDSVLIGKPTVRLKDLSRKGGLIKIIGLLLLTGVCLYGVKWYVDQSNQVEEIAVAPPEEKLVIPPMPWDGAAIGVKAIEVCYNEIMKFPSSLPGWTVKDFICRPSSNVASKGGKQIELNAFIDRNVSIEKGGATLSHLDTYLKSRGYNPVYSYDGTSDPRALKGSPTTVGVQITAGSVPVYPADLNTPKLSEMLPLLLRIFETRGISPQFAPKEDLSITDSQGQTHTYLRGEDIQFDTHAKPSYYSDIISAVQSYILDELKYNVELNNFVIKGSAYEQGDIPPNATIQKNN